MIAIAISCALAALQFVDQPLDDVHVGDLNPLTGTPDVNYRHEDVDGDAQAEILLPNAAYFRRGQEFARAGFSDLPLPHSYVCDTWGGRVYMLSAEELCIVRWRDQQWAIESRHPAEWELNFAGMRLRQSPDDTTPRQRFERVLHDLDGDGNPELLIPVEHGIALFTARSEGVAHAGTLDIFPPMRIARVGRQPLWPPEKRGLAFPARRMACRYFLDRNTVSVLTEEPSQGATVRYRIATFNVVRQNNLFELDPAEPVYHDTPPLPAHIQPCRLDPAGQVRFAGGDWRYSDTTAAPSGMLPRPIFETVVCGTSGESSQRVRSISFRPKVLFVDFDGDGRLDLVSETMSVLESGPREAVTRLFTTRSLDHRVEIRLQDTNGAFANTPAVTGDVTFRFSRNPIPADPMFHAYLAGQLVDVTGDFNGDGRRDIAIKHTHDSIAIHLSEPARASGEFRYASAPAATIPVHPDDYFSIADIDADGLSDIQTARADESVRSGIRRRTFLARIAPS